MKNLENELYLKGEYASLDEMIKQTSTAFEALIQSQGAAFELQYSQGTKYMYLVKKQDSKKTCYGVRWMKYSISPQTGMKRWDLGWSPGKVPASAKKSINSEEQKRFQQIDQLALKISRLRDTLTSKKKRIISTFQNIRQTDKACLQGVLERVETFRNKIPEGGTVYF